MKKFTLGAFCLLSFAADSFSQPLTPVLSIVLKNEAIEVPSRFAAVFPAGKKLNIPDGYKARVFHAGQLVKPRFMDWGPDGVLYVADMRAAGNGKIYALPDVNKDGVADTVIVAADGFTNNHDVKFYKGAMYVTESVKIWKCTDNNADGYYETKTVFIDNVGDGTAKGHTSRTIVFDSVNKKVYLSIGSSCNVCRESTRAIIEEYNDDGTGKRTYATGIRNAVGMALHPTTNRLWANNNGSDNQGNEVPPEWIDIIRENGFYGHPFAHSFQQWFDFNAAADYTTLKPITAKDSSNVASMIAPAALIRAHSAPLGMQFLNPSFPASWNQGFLTALHGSWNTTNPKDFRGYKVIYSKLSSASDTTVDFVSDFISGFLTDTVNRIYWGRPAGLLADNNGSIYMTSDDSARFVLLLYPDSTTTSVIRSSVVNFEDIYPVPAKSQINVPFHLYTDEVVSIIITDITGRVLLNFRKGFNAGHSDIGFNIGDFSPGVYFVATSAAGQYKTQKFVVE